MPHTDIGARQSRSLASATNVVLDHPHQISAAMPKSLSPWVPPQEAEGPQPPLIAIAPRATTRRRNPLPSPRTPAHSTPTHSTTYANRIRIASSFHSKVLLLTNSID